MLKKGILGMLVALLLLGAVELILSLTLGPWAKPIQVHSSVGEFSDWLVERSGQVRPIYKLNAATFPAQPTLFIGCARSVPSLILTIFET